jgi:hypothetical protein
MQTELLDRQRWTTRVELANAIFEYLETFHNLITGDDATAPWAGAPLSSVGFRGYCAGNETKAGEVVLD